MAKVICQQSLNIIQSVFYFLKFYQVFQIGLIWSLCCFCVLNIYKKLLEPFKTYLLCSQHYSYLYILSPFISLSLIPLDQISLSDCLFISWIYMLLVYYIYQVIFLDHIMAEKIKTNTKWGLTGLNKIELIICKMRPSQLPPSFAS